jgi:hypothetical protein
MFYVDVVHVHVFSLFSFFVFNSIRVKYPESSGGWFFSSSSYPVSYSIVPVVSAAQRNRPPKKKEHRVYGPGNVRDGERDEEKSRHHTQTDYPQLFVTFGFACLSFCLPQV